MVANVSFSTPTSSTRKAHLGGFTAVVVVGGFVVVVGKTPGRTILVLASCGTGGFPAWYELFISSTTFLAPSQTFFIPFSTDLLTTSPLCSVSCNKSFFTFLHAFLTLHFFGLHNRLDLHLGLVPHFLSHFPRVRPSRFRLALATRTKNISVSKTETASLIFRKAS